MICLFLSFLLIQASFSPCYIPHVLQSVQRIKYNFHHYHSFIFLIYSTQAINRLMRRDGGCCLTYARKHSRLPLQASFSTPSISWRYLSTSSNYMFCWCPFGLLLEIFWCIRSGEQGRLMGRSPHPNELVLTDCASFQQDGRIYELEISHSGDAKWFCKILLTKASICSLKSIVLVSMSRGPVKETQENLHVRISTAPHSGAEQDYNTVS